MSGDLLDRARRVVATATTVYRGTPHERAVAAVAERLAAPLRVAIAGRVKSGKSTLLNALVGERLAPTDAGECTRIVTWYADGPTYRVLLHLGDGTTRPARFRRENGTLDISLDGTPVESVDRISVDWPSRSLRTATLIDTPGVGSMTVATSRRSWELLAPEDESTPADAVVYLMKHLHAADVEFLRAFHDREVARPNPVNSLGILSRADEIGVGRPDAMASARRIARRLSTEPKIRQVLQTVVPVAGLLAETATTLTEHEYRLLHRVASRSPDDVDAMLLTADRFVVTDHGPELGEAERRGLIARLGLFGVRLSVSVLRDAPTTTASQLARTLTSHSGLDDLVDLLRTLFFERSDVLKARSALLAVDALVRDHPVAGSDLAAAAVEEAIAAAHPFHELRVLSALRAGWVTGKESVLGDLERVVGGGGAAPHLRLDLPRTASPDELRRAAEDRLATWQRRAASPLASRPLVVAAEVAVRSCEGILAELPPPAAGSP
ncbi:MAG: dynamin family protein [Kineosporiaceae bacterium]